MDYLPLMNSAILTDELKCLAVTVLATVPVTSSIVAVPSFLNFLAEYVADTSWVAGFVGPNFQ